MLPFCPPSFIFFFFFSSAKPFSAYNFWNAKHMPGCSAAQVPPQQPLLALYQSQSCLWSGALCLSPACCGRSSCTAAPAPLPRRPLTPACSCPRSVQSPSEHAIWANRWSCCPLRVWLQFSCHFEAQVWGFSRAVTSRITQTPTSRFHVLSQGSSGAVHHLDFCFILRWCYRKTMNLASDFFLNFWVFFKQWA